MYSVIVSFLGLIKSFMWQIAMQKILKNIEKDSCFSYRKYLQIFFLYNRFECQTCTHFTINFQFWKSIGLFNIYDFTLGCCVVPWNQTCDR